MLTAAKRTLALTALCLTLTAPAALHAQDGPPQEGNGPAMGMGRGRGVRGTVVAASGSNVTLKTEAGETWTVIATDNTRVNVDRQPTKVADLKAGDEVMAMGVPDPAKHELHALAIMGFSAAQVAKLKADLGKTYIVGKITAMDETKLSILRPDKVTQVISLDETTSLHRGGRLPAEYAAMGTGGGFGGGGGRRGEGRRTEGTPNETSGGNPATGNDGEAITLADVKLGDNLAATGSLKNGTFVPTDLHVNTPRPRGPRPAGAPSQP